MPARDVSGQMLEDIVAVLQKYGRARKNPGMGRPVAVTADNMVLAKVTKGNLDKIKRLSLPGAFRYVELTGRYGKVPTEKAKRAFYQEQTGQNSFGAGDIDAEIAKIDQDVSDTRLILRNLRAARKKIRKANAAASA